MEAKYFKLIIFLSLVLSIMGIFIEIYDYFQIRNYEKNIQNEIIPYFLWIFRSLYIYIGLEQTSLNVYNLILYILLLCGTFFFYMSKGKELRLIRFFYSVLLVSNIFMVLRIFLINTIFSYDKEILPEFQTKIYVFKIIGFLFCVFYTFLGYKILKITTMGRELDITKKENSEIVIITETSKTERFLHLLFDTVIIVSMLSFLIEIILDYQRYQNEEIIPAWLNNEFGLIIFLAAIRFIYYPFFEILFGATPGKFLTNSRVINAKSEIPDAENIFARTLYRHIPFEIFSFFGKKGWHDSISKTYVVKEKNNGVKSSYLVWIFVFCFVVFCFYLYKNFIERF